MNINQVLEQAPAIISQRAEEELKLYEQKIFLEENYKRLWAKKFLEMKAAGGKSLDQIKAELENEAELTAIKDKELLTEISYKSMRIKRERAQNMFESAKCQGYIRKAEIKNLNDTIQE